MNRSILVVGQNKLEKDGFAYLSKIYSAKVDLCKTISEALLNNGWDSHYYDTVNRVIEIGTKKMNDEIVEEIIFLRPKYVLFMLGDLEIFNSTLLEARKQGCKAVGYFFDDAKTFDVATIWRVDCLDLCVTVDSPLSLSHYARIGKEKKVVFIPVGADDRLLYKQANSLYEFDVSFVGQNYLNRAHKINTISQMMENNGIKGIECFGYRWTNGVVSEARMNEIYNSSKINLVFSGTDNGQKQLKGKIFEICMAGGFLLAEYAPGLENCFELGKEIVTFRNLDEAYRLIVFYLTNPSEREKIADSGYHRARENYTWGKSTEKMVRELEKTCNEIEPVNLLATSYTKPIHFSLLKEFRARYAKVMLEKIVAFYIDIAENRERRYEVVKIAKDVYGIINWKAYILNFVCDVIPRGFLAQAFKWIIKNKIHK